MKLYLIAPRNPESFWTFDRVEYGGKVVTYSGDTEWTEALVDAARGVDLFICEAHFFGKKIKCHLDYGTLETHRARLDCRRLVLTHMNGDMLGRQWGELVAELKRFHAQILSNPTPVPENFSVAARASVVLVVNDRTAGGGTKPIEWVEELDWKAYALVFRLHEIDHPKRARRAAGGDGAGR